MSRNILAFLLLAIAPTSLIGSIAMAKPEESVTSNLPSKSLPLVALMTPSASSFTNETIYDLVVHFSLKNVGAKNIDPKLAGTQLVIDGKPMQESALLFGNGPRDHRFSDLPPGDKLEFSYPLGHYLKTPGQHQMTWRGEGFKDVSININVVQEKERWKMIASGDWAKVLTERAVFKKPGSKHFFLHVRIDNQSAKTIGFESTNRFIVFYPNQWAESNEPRRQVISEMRRNQSDWSKGDRDELLFLYHETAQRTGVTLPCSGATGKPRVMVKVAPHKSYDYYISFNSGEYESIEAVKLAYAIVVMDGCMGMTDGAAVQIVRRDMNDMMQAEIPLPTPVKVQDMPPSANVLFDD